MWMFRSAAWLAGLCSICTVMSGCDESSGSCPTSELQADGWSYNLRVYNCTEVAGTIRLNERPVGEVEPYNDDLNECPYQDLGSFPMCNVGTIQIGGATESQVISWTPEAVSDPDQFDGCWMAIVYIGGGVLPDDYSLADGDPELSDSDLCDTEYMEGIVDLSEY